MYTRLGDMYKEAKIESVTEHLTRLVSQTTEYSRPENVK